MNKYEKIFLTIYCILILGWLGSRLFIFECEKVEYKKNWRPGAETEQAYENIESGDAELLDINGVGK